MVKENEFCSKVTETQFIKPLIITEKYHEDFNISNKFWVSKRAYEGEEDEVKVKDHNQCTAKYRGSTHQQ